MFARTLAHRPMHLVIYCANYNCALHLALFAFETIPTTEMASSSVCQAIALIKLYTAMAAIYCLLTEAAHAALYVLAHSPPCRHHTQETNTFQLSPTSALRSFAPSFSMKTFCFLWLPLYLLDILEMPDPHPHQIWCARISAIVPL